LVRLRSGLLLTLVIGVVAVWGAAAGSGRVFDTWAYLKDTASDSGNTIATDTLDPPSGLSASPHGATAVDLTWTASPDAYASGYDIFRRTDPGSYGGTPTVSVTESAANCITPGDTSCAYQDSSLSSGTKYCYRVRATYQNWVSALSSESCATTGGATEHATLVPNADKNNTTGSGNDWNSGASGNPACGTDSIATTCSSQIDEDIDSPTPDFIFNDSPSSQFVEFQLTDAPSDLVTLTSINARLRADVLGPRTVTLKLDVFKADGTLLGTATFTLSTTAADYSLTVNSLSLGKSDVNGLYIRLTSDQTGGGGTTRGRVYTVNLDITYSK
jgi:hypothetical protein